ncbi:MAG: hypothetical protein Q4B60_03420 [Erysipelotrichaceae bacterium]|nr:hypothetical protein [Erysipelotrichaceae bacterium]
MEVLTLINQYIKYVYLFMLVVIVIALIKLMMTLAQLSKTAKPINDGLNNINNNVEALNKKSEEINNNLKESVPFFMNIILSIALLNAVLDDFFKTKRSKRSLTKSYSKMYKYHKAMHPTAKLFGK